MQGSQVKTITLTWFEMVDIYSFVQLGTAFPCILSNC